MTCSVSKTRISKVYTVLEVSHGAWLKTRESAAAFYIDESAQILATRNRIARITTPTRHQRQLLLYWKLSDTQRRLIQRIKHLASTDFYERWMLDFLCRTIPKALLK